MNHETHPFEREIVPAEGGREGGNGKSVPNRHAIAILGSEYTGKTCFLAGLGVLSEGDREGGFYLSCEGESKQFMSGLLSTLRRREWPASTQSDFEFKGTLRFKGHDFRLEMVEYAGEHFREHFSQGSQPVAKLSESLNKCEFILLALDPEVELSGGEANLDAGERDRYKGRLDSLLEALHQLRYGRGGSENFDLAVMITKADLVAGEIESLGNPRKYLQTKARAFYDRLKSDFGVPKVFAVSAVGSTEFDTDGNRLPAKDLAPYGYEPIFAWMLNRIWAKRRSRRGFITAVGFAIAIIGVVSYMVYQERSSLQKLAEFEAFSSRPIEEDTIYEGAEIAKQLEDEDYQNKVDALLAESGEALRIEGLGRSNADTMLKRLYTMERSNNPYRISDIQSAIGDWQTKLEEIDFEQVRIAYETGGAEFDRLSKEFLERYPNSSRRNPISGWIEDRIYRTMARHALDIHAMEVGTLDRLTKKSRAIFEFLNEYPAAPERSSMEQAARLAQILAEDAARGNLEVELRWVGDLYSPGYMTLRITVGGTTIASEQSEYTKRYTFDNRKRFPIDWEPGRSIQIVLNLDWGTFGSDVVVAERTLYGDLAIDQMHGSIKLHGVDGRETDFDYNSPTLSCEIVGWTDSDWRLIEDWISPGTKWTELFADER